ncbi:uncharacterized protein LOC101847266 [Aplysia californica]|uniref:Uncharacterized protein LOC101847266 n=1 Tax=Aplysia californica TaxID=6500 RepID=A0ABM0JSH5_APLCA|nr:uncharacterized protein LOC101847266 [Aplysia californica]XP_005100490.1 uncharacterized protein LOC101847266 [Aplysia californica]
MFKIIKFPEQGEVGMISHAWKINESEVWHPHGRNKATLNKMIRAHAVPVPGPDWKKHKVWTIYETDDFDKARQKLRAAEETSDLDTGSERKRKLQKRLQSSASSSDDDEYNSKRRKSSSRKRKQSSSSSSDSDDYNSRRRKTAIRKRRRSRSSSSDDDEYNSRRRRSASRRGKSVLKSHGKTRRKKKRRDESFTETEHQPGPSSRTSSPQPPPVTVLPTLEMLHMHTEQISKLHELILSVKNEILEAVRVSNDKPLEYICKSLDDFQNESYNSIPEGVTLPISSLREFEKAEEMLSSPSVADHMVNYLALLGGVKVKQTAYIILRHVLAPQFATTITWTGSKQTKMAFCGTRWEEVILRAIRRNPHLKETTALDYRHAVQDFFRTAPDRNGARRKRRQKQERENPISEPTTSRYDYHPI